MLKMQYVGNRHTHKVATIALAHVPWVKVTVQDSVPPMHGQRIINEIFIF